MRTTAAIEDELWNEAQRVVDAPSKRALLEAGLQALIDQAARRRSIALAGVDA